MPNSWRPLFLMTSAISGASCRLTDGMKNVAGMRFLSSSSTTRRNPCRDPYCPMDSAPAFASPKRSATVSLSTSKESRTATRAPFGHGAVRRFLPARTVFTTVVTLSIVHCQPGFAFVCGTGWACASASDGTRAARRVSFMADDGGSVVGGHHERARQGGDPSTMPKAFAVSKVLEPLYRRARWSLRLRARHDRNSTGARMRHSNRRLFAIALLVFPATLTAQTFR